ncbi:hypothetical protein T484DRAFT_3047448 [Baffinella frigidus]|nr:hypothetical protein T484DRAFT_3047448 [Cryptophyta sp. CCMP2293]
MEGDEEVSVIGPEAWGEASRNSGLHLLGEASPAMAVHVQQQDHLIADLRMRVLDLQGQLSTTRGMLAELVDAEIADGRLGARGEAGGWEGRASGGRRASEEWGTDASRDQSDWEEDLSESEGAGGAGLRAENEGLKEEVERLRNALQSAQQDGVAQKVVEQCEKMTQGMALRALSHDLSQALALVSGARAEEARWWGGWDVGAARPFWARELDLPHAGSSWCTMAVPTSRLAGGGILRSPQRDPPAPVTPAGVPVPHVPLSGVGSLPASPAGVRPQDQALAPAVLPPPN